MDCTAISRLANDSIVLLTVCSMTCTSVHVYLMEHCCSDKIGVFEFILVVGGKFNLLFCLSIWRLWSDRHWFSFLSFPDHMINHLDIFTYVLNNILMYFVTGFQDPPKGWCVLFSSFFSKRSKNICKAFSTKKKKLQKKNTDLLLQNKMIHFCCSLTKLNNLVSFFVRL